MEYLVAFILAIIGICFNKNMPSKIRIVYMVAIWTYIVILLGLRYRVGVDTISYMNGFKHVKTLGEFWNSEIFGQRYEPGYLLVCSICKTINKDFWFLQMTMAAITNGCIFIFLHRYCKNVFVGILVYFFLQWLYFSVEIMRESAAIGIFLLNYRNLEKKRWLEYYLLSILSISFHYSAVIIWLFPFVKILKLNLFYVILCIGILSITPIVEKVNDVLPFPTIAARIDMYLNITETLNLNWKIGELIRSAFPSIAVLIAYHMTKSNLKFKSILLFQILLCIGAFAIPLVFSRFMNYTTMFVTVALANFLSIGIVRAWVKVALVGVILLTQSYHYYTMYPRWIPYVSILNPKQIQVREQIWKYDFLFAH